MATSNSLLKILVGAVALFAGATPARAQPLEATAGAESRGAFTPPRPPAALATCAGVRGNGRNIFAHYGVLARQVEEYGAVTCAAGGSSGSITVFLLESMWINPATHLCRGRRCSTLERDQRLALQLKSVIGLTDAGLFEDAATVSALLAGIQQGRILELLRGPVPQQGVEALIRLLRDLGPLINQDAITLLVTSPNPVFHATDIVEGLQKGAQFIIDDPRVFVRTSVLDFNQVAALFGLYGSFYAGYGPFDGAGYEAWLAACAAPSRGRTWEETARLPGVAGETCGGGLKRLFNSYRERVAAGGGRRRIDDRVGAFLPVFGVTGVIKGASIDLWRQARAAWLAATPIPFEPYFLDVGNGYWGDPQELRRMQRALARSYPDLASRQFTPLGQTSWREVLASSPAEPGFSPAVPLSAGVLSVGGWADPLRVLPLEALGARETIAVNRLGGVGSFTEDAARLLNATEADITALFSYTDPRSSFYQGLARSTGVWCTDWDGQDSVPNRLFNDAYWSPLITRDRRFLAPRFGYANVGPNYQIEGCTPGFAAQNGLGRKGRY